MTSNLNFTFPVEQLANAIIEKLRPQLPAKVEVTHADDRFLTRI